MKNIQSKIIHNINRFIHNTIIHPLIQFLPRIVDRKVHNWHSNLTWGIDNRDIWEDRIDIINRYCNCNKNNSKKYLHLTEIKLNIDIHKDLDRLAMSYNVVEDFIQAALDNCFEYEDIYYYITKYWVD